MQRIYLPNTQFGKTLTIAEKELYHQITRVMRARVGQCYIFFDGESLEDYKYQIMYIDKNNITFELVEIIKRSHELEAGLTLYQAFPNKLSKLDKIVEKCTEVGYKHIVFFKGEYSGSLVLSESKKRRLEKIAIEATEQCGGNIVPSLGILPDIYSVRDEKNLYFCHTKDNNSQTLQDINVGKSISFIVGPEGGLSEKEIIHLKKIQAGSLYLGKRIFRLETVAPLLGFVVSQKFFQS